ncbi:MAG: AAA family ATPase [Desulfatibacillum sp.]|nr:AAA family ATPase [Desulfatibacillum sp.]
MGIDPFEKRILFITGKGGVGKTTVAAAMAYAARDRGLNVCLVEVTPSPNMRMIFEQDIPLYKETEVDRNITVLTIEPFRALHEYVGLQLKIGGAARLIMNNRLLNYFLNTAPGWRELITVGKIWHLQDMKAKWSKKPRFDLIVVDSPATGHGLSFLKVPSVFMNIIKMGRMQGQTADVQAMLTDPAISLLNVVTLPEEMPVNESISLLNTARDELHMPTGFTFVNSAYSPLFDEASRESFEKLKEDPEAMERLKEVFPDNARGLFSALENRQARVAQSQYYENLVREKIGPPIVRIPHLYPGRVDKDGVKKVAEIISQNLNKDA